MADGPIAVRVINLDRTPERLDLFRALNPALRFTRFAASDGQARPREDWIAEGLIDPTNLYRPGAIGAAASHVRLWREALAGGRALHVMEDDVVVRRDFPEVAESLLDRLEAWDIVAWTWNFDWPLRFRPAAGLDYATLHLDALATRDRLGPFQDATVRPLLAPIGAAPAMGCYSISPRGAAALLRRCLPIGSEQAGLSAGAISQGWDNTGIDVEVSRHYDALSAFVAIPPLAVPLNDHQRSTVQRA